MLFSTGMFFNENNIAKLVVNNGLSKEIVETIAPNCWLLFSQTQINMIFFSSHGHCNLMN